MRTLLTGTVNGMAFILSETGKVECEDAELSRMISDGALEAIKRFKEKLLKLDDDRLAWDVALELEACHEAKIQVNQAYDYDGETTLVFHYHISEDQDCSKRLFMRGRLRKTLKFKTLVDHSTEVVDENGQWIEASSHVFEGILRGMRGLCEFPETPDINYEIYKLMKSDMHDRVIEQACFYHYPLGYKSIEVDIDERIRRALQF